MTISADLLRGYTDTIIMQQLTDADGYGYGISRAIAEKSEGMVGDEATGARRRYYSLTEPGRTKLAEEKDAWEETRRVMDTLLDIWQKHWSNNDQ